MRFAGVHVGALLLFSALNDSLMLGARFLAYPVLGWGAYEYPLWHVHLAMEVMKDVVAYGLIAVGYGLFHQPPELGAQRPHDEAEILDRFAQVAGEDQPVAG